MHSGRRQLNAHAGIFFSALECASRCLLAAERGAVIRVRRICDFSHDD